MCLTSDKKNNILRSAFQVAIRPYREIKTENWNTKHFHAWITKYSNKVELIISSNTLQRGEKIRRAKLTSVICQIQWNLNKIISAKKQKKIFACPSVFSGCRFICIELLKNEDVSWMICIFKLASRWQKNSDHYFKISFGILGTYLGHLTLIYSSSL